MIIPMKNRKQKVHPRYKIGRSCTMKIRFDDEYEADKVARKKSKQYGHYLRSYYCSYCDGYHLSSREDLLIVGGEDN